MSAPALRRRSTRSLAAEQKFRETIAARGARVIGQWTTSNTPIEVICADGHACHPWPGAVLRGQGICYACAGRDPATNEERFRKSIAERGARVVGPYVNSCSPVKVICANNHTCRPTPIYTWHGHGICRVCAGVDSATAESAFRANIAARGARQIGPYVNNKQPVEAICANGHTCRPTPVNVAKGAGICRVCQGKAWDVFYVTTNPAVGRVKIGVTSNDERRRLAEHRTAGYTEVVRILSDLPNADALERHVLFTLRDAGVQPVQGREYYDIGALALILDVVDGWAAP